MQAKLFGDGIPECTTARWYAEREHAPHLEQEGHRQRLLLSADMVGTAVARGARTVCDLGAGDGGLLSLIKARWPDTDGWGYDLQPSNVAAAAARGVRVELTDVTAVQPSADVLIATEILEHLVDPHGFLAGLHAPWLVASSPYTETAESHYDFHLWAWDQAGYRAMLKDAGWTTVAFGTAWICQVHLAARVLQ